MLENYIDLFQDKMVHSVCDLINIPSVYEQSNDPNKPFGESINKALEYILELGKSLGFKTKNMDGYCGYIELGEGEELVGIIGHLDVVPGGDNWDTPPFAATISNGCIYGRGAIDDKGPVIASLYAMKAVKEYTTVHKRVRLILGLNEERDWKGISYYKQKEEHPSISFSPDADFPCIYAEKAVITMTLLQHYFPSEQDSIILKKLFDDHNAINVVPKLATAILKVNSSMEECISLLKEIIQRYGYEIDIYKMDDHHLKLTSYGTAAHSAHPDLGVNAISRLLIVLYGIFMKHNLHLPLLDKFFQYLNEDFNGNKLGINIPDESGILTCNVGTLSFENDQIQIGLNLRVPIHTSTDFVQTKIKEQMEVPHLITIAIQETKPSLFLPKDHSLVQTLCHIFNETTGLNASPIAIGGATYARAFPNCVSFGPNMPGSQDMCHQANEFISLSNLTLSSKLYAKAIYELAK